jgi:hypothetical protein
VIPEHAMVESVKEIRYGQVTFPVGSIGTVVHVVDGRGYYVEFTDPIHIVVDAGMDEIKEIKCGQNEHS